MAEVRAEQLQHRPEGPKAVPSASQRESMWIPDLETVNINCEYEPVEEMYRL